MIIVEQLKKYTPEDAVALGRLRPFLTEGSSDEPVDEQLLRGIIESPDRVQLVARDEETQQIIGTATLNLIYGALFGKKGELQDFVADPTAGIPGIGQMIWDKMGEWCRENDVDLEFTSRPSREKAHKFYLKNGAEIRETTVFKKKFD